jgi:hypothetical protein
LAYVRGNFDNGDIHVGFSRDFDTAKGSTVVTLVRPLDATERLFYRWGERNPAHFSIVAEFGEVLAEDQVQAALRAVQNRHPLLSVHVEDRPASRLGFYRAESVAGIPLAVHERDDSQWQLLAADELARPLDRSTAPLMRAVLLKGKSTSAVLLTFEHTIADGISSVVILNDLVASLNGRRLTARGVPPSQEETIALRLPSQQDQAIRVAAAADPRMLKPNSIRPFDATPSHVHTVALRSQDTARLADRCRTERTTVHAAIVTAASRVRATLGGQDFVRVLSPINIRSLINVGEDCADYFTCKVTGMAPRDGSDFWDQTRAVTAELSIARSGSSIAAGSAIIRQTVPVDVETDTAEELFTAGLPRDLMVSNLGVQDLTISGPVTPTALWGPLLNTQINGDYVTGVVTYRRRLRIVMCAYAPTADCLKNLAATLVQVSS